MCISFLYCKLGSVSGLSALGKLARDEIGVSIKEMSHVFRGRSEVFQYEILLRLIYLTTLIDIYKKLGVDLGERLELNAEVLQGLPRRSGICRLPQECQ